MNEWIAMSVLAGLILMVGGYYLYSGIRTLRRTTPAFEMLPDERRFLRRQAWRRIINSFLMLLLSVELVAAYASGLPERIDGIISERERATVNGVKPPLTDEQRQSVRFFGGCVIAFMLQLGVVIALAGLDFWATRRYALSKFRQIATERRAMIQRQLTKWREEREQD